MDKKAPTVTTPNYDHVWAEVYGDMQDVGPTHRHMRRILKRMLNQIEYNSVLDVGCGAGHNLPLLLEGRTLSKVAGLDISAKALDLAQQTYEGTFHQLDIQEGHLNGKWDLVFSSLLLEHIPDDLAALKNMYTMTAKHLLVTTIAGDFERYRTWDEQMGHVRNYQVGELEDKIAKVGFSVQETIYWGFPFYTPLARTLQNKMKSTSTFGLTKRLQAEIMYYLYFLNSYRRGDVLFVLARV